MNGYVVKLFGPLKRQLPEGQLFLESPKPITVAALKSLLEHELRARQCFFPLAPVAVGTASRILADEEMVPFDEPVAFLPPVCGG